MGKVSRESTFIANSKLTLKTLLVVSPLFTSATINAWAVFLGHVIEILLLDPNPDKPNWGEYCKEHGPTVPFHYCYCSLAFSTS